MAAQSPIAATSPPHPRHPEPTSPHKPLRTKRTHFHFPTRATPPRSRLVPLPESANKMATQLNEPALFGHGSLTDAVLKLVRLSTAVDVVRADIKVDMLS